MKIIIAGAGKVGSSIAKSLSREGHDITVIIRELEECKNEIHLSGRRDEMTKQQEGKTRSHRMIVMFNIQS